MRYAYIKNGDGVDQVKKLARYLNNSPNSGPSSGPDAFIYDYLMNINDDPIIILSRSKDSKSYKYKNIEARTLLFSGPLILKINYAMSSFVATLLYLVKFKPDIIVCGKTGSMLWSSYLFSRFYKKKFIHSRHNRVTFSQESILKKMIIIIDNWVVRNSYSVICHGPYLKDQLLEIGVNPGRLYEFDINYNDIYLLKNKLENMHEKTEEENKFILYVGRLEIDKGIFDLLYACNEIFGNYPDLHLFYAGDGSARCDLQNIINNNYLNDRVKILGYIEHDDLVKYISRSLFTIAPTKESFHEGRCMAAIESLIMGVPVIAPDFGPFPYLIKDGINGLLYKPDSVNDLKMKIYNLLEDNKLRTRLYKGAEYSAKKLIQPNLTFGQALFKAINT